ncbi:MAG: hypothetical protein SF123_04630 [Chloroflexota bacterium]|nr:hypothetical protein [Chloroflexota bacterium]
MVMLHLEIDEAVAERLRRRAVEAQQSLEAVAADVLTQSVLAHGEAKPLNPLLLLADMAEQLDLRSGRSDISENFDAVMSEFIAEDIKRHHGDNHGKTTDSP